MDAVQERLFQEYFDLTGRTALVTGGTKGLGFEMARTLARAGAQVAVCSRHAEEAEAAAQAIQTETGRRCWGGAADVSHGPAIEGFVSEMGQRLGEPDILVVSAGINIRKPTEALMEEDFDALMAVNVRGAWLAARAVLPARRRRRWGRIVFDPRACGLCRQQGCSARIDADACARNGRGGDLRQRPLSGPL